MLISLSKCALFARFGSLQIAMGKVEKMATLTSAHGNIPGNHELRHYAPRQLGLGPLPGRTFPFSEKVQLFFEDATI